MRHFGTRTKRPLGLMLTLAVVLSSLVAPPITSRAATPPPSAPAQAPSTPPSTVTRGWLAKLEQFGGDFVRTEMVKAFLVSIEYTRRFVP
jgi:hypothetical protein